MVRPRGGFVKAVALFAFLGGAPVGAATERQEQGRMLAERGRAAAGAGRFDEALRLFEEANEVDPRPTYLWSIGRAAEQLGALERGRTALESLVRTARPDHPLRPQAEAALARIRAELAEQRAARLGAGAPEAAEALYATGRALYREGAFDRAAHEFQSALDRFPRSAKLEYSLGRCYEHLGRDADALRHFEGFLALVAADHVDAKATRRVVARLRERAFARLPEVVVTSAPAGASVYFESDHAPAGVTPLKVRKTPGAHVMRVMLEGHREAFREIEVADGQRNAVLVMLEPIEASTGTDADPWSRPAGWVLVGLGAVAVGVGGYFVADAFATADDANAVVADDAAYDTLAADAERSQLIGWGAVGGGLAAGVAGIVLLWVADEPEPALAWRF